MLKNYTKAIMSIINILVYSYYLYLAIGLIFGIWFAFAGAQKLDQGMKNAGWAMRLLLIPGALALWPVLIKKLFNSTSPKI